MCDVFVITSIYHIILKKYNKVENKYYLLGIIGALSFFLSHITPIILLTCGIYLVYVDFLNKNLKLKYLIGLILVWTISFLLYYYFFVYNHPAEDNFKGYWLKMNTFMPINPLKIDFYQFHFDKIKICIGYEYQGNKTDRMSKLISDLSDVQPIYKTFDGWNEPITDIDSYNGLPKKTQKYIQFIADFISTPVKIISTGPGRDEIIRIN